VGVEPLVCGRVEERFSCQWMVGEIVRSHEVLDLEDGQIVVVLEDNRNAAKRLRGPGR
jgi:hypothetical protein